MVIHEEPKGGEGGRAVADRVAISSLFGAEVISSVGNNITTLKRTLVDWNPDTLELIPRFECPDGMDEAAYLRVRALVKRLRTFRDHGVHVLGSFIFGLPSDRPSTFEATADGFRDRETGSAWTLLGAAHRGPLAGKRLRAIVHVDAFWFAWAAFHPTTSVHTE